MVFSILGRRLAARPGLNLLISNNYPPSERVGGGTKSCTTLGSTKGFRRPIAPRSSLGHTNSVTQADLSRVTNKTNWKELVFSYCVEAWKVPRKQTETGITIWKNFEQAKLSVMWLQAHASVH